MNINNIIRESINGIIIESVASLFQDLWNRCVKLQQCRLQIHNTNLKATRNGEIVSFIGHEFYNFIAELESAIKRCVTAKNINESLADYGIQMPSGLNAWTTAQQYYYNMKDMLTGREGYNTASQYANKTARRKGTRRRNLRNEKLLYLLNTVWPPMQREFLVLNNQYNFNRVCPAAVAAKTEIDEIIVVVNQIQQQQTQQKKKK